MKVLDAGRQQGKTHRSFEWVQRGAETRGYPGWTRVLVLPNRQMFDDFRKRYWEVLPDFDHRVYDYMTWANCNTMSRPSDCEVRLDNLEFFPFMSGVGGFTITGERWEDELQVGAVDRQMANTNPLYAAQLGVLKQTLRMLEDRAEELALTPNQIKRITGVVLYGDPDWTLTSPPEPKD